VLSGTRDCPGRKRGDSTFRKVKLYQSVFRQEAFVELKMKMESQNIGIQRYASFLSDPDPGAFYL